MTAVTEDIVAQTGGVNADTSQPLPNTYFILARKVELN